MHCTRIKICGVDGPQTAITAAQAGADAIGLVFVEKSPRCVNTDQAAEIVRALPTFVEPIGLFVDASVNLIRRTAAQHALQTVQLHGRESADFAAQLKPLRVIKAFAFEPDKLATTIQYFSRRCDNLATVLLDAPPDENPNALLGGTGTSFDWAALTEFKQQLTLPDNLSIALAGGLTADNVADAIRICRPDIVDVSSGVESAPGVKDADKIFRFCHNVRQADHNMT